MDLWTVVGVVFGVLWFGFGAVVWVIAKVLQEIELWRHGPYWRKK